MVKKSDIERRKYVRLDLKTKVKFQVLKGHRGSKPLLTKTPGISRNTSVEGICFASVKKLVPKTKLNLEVFLPHNPKPLHLKGEVKWSQAIVRQRKGKQTFDTGVKLFSIDKRDENMFIVFVCAKMSERLSRFLYY
ncbi:MAG: PilZ domain-containing protein [Candidatus Omnitrophica bacterium]|nr:PilZ domain-containing protein [Candidatus Omnitrophota bacterium]